MAIVKVFITIVLGKKKRKAVDRKFNIYKVSVAGQRLRWETRTSKDYKCLKDIF